MKTLLSIILCLFMAGLLSFAYAGQTGNVDTVVYSAIEEYDEDIGNVDYESEETAHVVYSSYEEYDEDIGNVDHDEFNVDHDEFSDTAIVRSLPSTLITDE